MTIFNIKYGNLNNWEQIIFVIGLAIASHLIVSLVRWTSRRLMMSALHGRLLKIRTVISLVSSLLVFMIYFGALGLVLVESGIPIGTYLASASIIGLAVAFGSQGIVQDFVTGLTIIFTGLFDVDEIVEIGGQTGIVRRLGMRFTVLTNAMGAEVYIPNRSIANVIRYPRGYLRCIADVTLTGGPQQVKQMEQSVRQIVTGVYEQFPGILRTPPDYEGIQKTSSGRQYLRVKYRIWPGRGTPIEMMFKQEAIQAMKAIDVGYADWMIAINYEVEEKKYSTHP